MRFAFRTFGRGTHPPANKFTADSPLVRLDVPEKLFLPLSQHIGAPAIPVVSVGDSVAAGQLVGESGGKVSARVHSPVSGRVEGIVSRPTASGGKCVHIVIVPDGEGRRVSMPVLGQPSPEEVKERVREAGIVGMGGAGFPTHVKLSPAKKPEFFLVNGAECEPYITCDCRLMTERAKEVVRGARLLAYAAGADKALIGVESNKKEAYAAILAECVGDDLGVSVQAALLRTKYPQGAEKQLVFALTGRRVPPGGLPADVGCVVDNVHTAYAVCRAADFGEPLTERVLTVGGREAGRPGNYFVAIGTPFSFVRDMTRGEKSDDDLVKIINGGPMMGIAQSGLDASVGKTTSSLLFFGEKEAALQEPTQCINCGRCIRCCPMKLSPRDIERATLEKDTERLEELYVQSCMECGVCSYVCPAKRPLVHAIRLAKKTLRERGGGK